MQYDAIFSGRVAVTSREGGRDVRREYSAGDFIARRRTAHLFEFLNHTVMAEWWEHVSNRGEPFEQHYLRQQRISAAMLRGGRDEAAEVKKKRGISGRSSGAMLPRRPQARAGEKVSYQDEV